MADEPITPLQIIDALNAMAGRPAGGPGPEYVDEAGRPIVPDWRHLGLGQTTVPMPEREGAHVVAAEGTTVTVGAPLPWEEPPMAVTVIPAPNVTEYLRLDNGKGVWRSTPFELSAKDLAAVRWIAVAAIKAALYAQADELEQEVRMESPDAESAG